MSHCEFLCCQNLNIHVLVLYCLSESPLHVVSMALIYYMCRRDRLYLFHLSSVFLFSHSGSVGATLFLPCSTRWGTLQQFVFPLCLMVPWPNESTPFYSNHSIGFLTSAYIHTQAFTYTNNDYNNNTDTVNKQLKACATATYNSKHPHLYLWLTYVSMPTVIFPAV